MLSRDHFYWGMFRKYCIAFAHVIGDIHVLRIDAAGATVKDITVPITYAQKSKLFYYLQRRDTLKKRVRTMLPRISFVINGMEFDPARKMNALNECTISTDSGWNETFQYAGTPWNFRVEMGIWAAYMDDLLQIIEQLATFFKPDYSLDVKEIPELGVTRSVPITLDGIDFDVANEFEEEDRVVRADASFTLKGWLYPPTSDSTLINHMYLNMRDMDSGTTAETLELDWDEINERIVTTIHDGPAYYHFASSASASTSSQSTGATGHNYASGVDITTASQSEVQV